MSFLRRNAPFLLAGILLTFCSSFGQTFFISVFAGEIRAEFGLSNGQWGLVYSAATTASAAAMVYAGLLTDAFRVRILGPAVIACLAAACILMWASWSVWALMAAIFALRFFGQGMSILVATVAMARWFVASRGMALAVSRIGVEFGSAFLPLIFVALMGTFVWHQLWLGSALILLLLAPFLWPLLRLERTPQSIATEEQSLGMNAQHWTRGGMLRHPLFWFAVSLLIAPPCFSTAFFFHQVHLAETKAWTHMGLVALFPFFTAAAVCAMFAGGAAVDRIGTGRILTLSILPMAAGFVVIALSGSLTGAAIGITLAGVTQGLFGTAQAAFWAEFYGTRFLGGIKSLVAALMVFGTAIGPALTGYLIDIGIPFEDQLVGIAAYFAVATLLLGIGVARSPAPAPLAA